MLPHALAASSTISILEAEAADAAAVLAAAELLLLQAKISYF